MRRSGFSFIHVLLLLMLTGAAWVFWELPALLPVRIIADLLYDSGKALAVLVTGGTIESVNAGLESGFTISTRGGAEGIYIFSGYLGAMLLGVFLLLATTLFRFNKLITMILGAGLVALALVFASVGSAMIYAVIFGVVLFLVGFILPGFINDLILKFFGMLGIFYSFFDVRGDLVFSGGHVSDVTRMAQSWFGTPLLWVVIWGAVGVLIFLITLRILLTSETGNRDGRRGGRSY